MSHITKLIRILMKRSWRRIGQERSSILEGNEIEKALLVLRMILENANQM